jgi:hypothetical protein
MRLKLEAQEQVNREKLTGPVEQCAVCCYSLEKDGAQKDEYRLSHQQRG